jgi:hypothetical protein
VAETPASILADASEQMWMALDPVTHTNTVMHEHALDVLRIALAKQRRLIARQLRSEAAAYRRRDYSAIPANQQLTYDGAVRRAARITEATDA